MRIAICSLISADLLAILHRMGRGDEIVFAGAHFPGETYGKRLLRANGWKIIDLLDAILLKKSVTPVSGEQRLW